MSVERLGRVVQWLALRTGSGPLRPLWFLVYRIVIWGVAGWVTLGCRGCRVYLKGGFGFGEPVYGLSDVDAIVVTDDTDGPEARLRARVEERWRRLTVRLPPLIELFQLWIYERDALGSLDADSYLTFALRASAHGSGDRTAFFGNRRRWDPMAVLERPGLGGPRRDWRRLGSRRRTPPPVSEPSSREIFAWLELGHLWAYAFALSADRTKASAAYTCQKLIADSARTWLWLRFGEQTFTRGDALSLALRRMPDEEEALLHAIELGRRLPRRPPPPLEEVLPFLARTSSKVACELASRATGVGVTSVKLSWDGADELVLSDRVAEQTHALEAAGAACGALLPLADWRARAVPGMLDLALLPVDGHPRDAAVLSRLALVSDEDFFPALRADGLLVMPTTEIWHRGRLRRIECSVSDPVSIALLDGRPFASFPNLPGWSAQDSATRALAEHRGWLSLLPSERAGELPYWMSPPYHPELVDLCGLFSAARAALFAESLRAGPPELPLTAAAITRGMAEYGPAARTAAQAGYEALTTCRRRLEPPDARTIETLRNAVVSLPPYAAAVSSGLSVG